MLNGYKIRDWIYLLLRSLETIAEHRRICYYTSQSRGKCTMQLVESSAHQGSGVVGMSHSGSVAQWKAYFGLTTYP